MPIQRVKAAIEAIKKGEMVIMMDDEDRENEGDIVYAATFSTPEKVNFCASEAKGLICVSLVSELAERLDLKPMVKQNTAQHSTAFTVSIDHVDCKTGISAHERDMTIRAMTDPLAKEEDFARPGHIFPLVAKEGGVLVRTGHTEGSIDLCRLAGVTPVAVICEIMKEDGSMARRDDLIAFGEKHEMKIVYVSDLIDYRMQHETLITPVSDENVEFFQAPARKVMYDDHLGRTHSVFIFGGIKKRMKVKFHNISPDLELMSNFAKYSSLIKSIEHLKQEGGVIVFMDDRLAETEQVKDIGIGSQILTHLGIQELDLVTAHSRRGYVGLSGYGIDIVKETIIDH